MAPVATSTNFTLSDAASAASKKLNYMSSALVNTKTKNSSTEDLVLRTIRCLSADLVQQFKGGHPGTAMGAASIAVALWRYVMTYNPANPDWFNRDRFVLSAGHACLLQYIQLHLTGYQTWSMDVLKSYHAPKFGIAAGHPEIEYPGIEVTTGPLGQGIANSVGLAMASKNLSATYNKPNYPVVDGKVWCFTGDGCLQEGVGQEALSLAGHLKLDNLIVVYDENAITVDGHINLTFTDDTNMKLQADGFHIIDVADGTNDIHTVVSALNEAKSYTGGKPVFVHIRTLIGYGSVKAGNSSTHGAALGDQDVQQVHDFFNVSEKFHIPQEVYDYYEPVKEKGREEEEKWNKMMEGYKNEYKAEYEELQGRLNGCGGGGMPVGWESALPKKEDLPKAAQPTRKSSGIVVQALLPKFKQLTAGSADLMESTFVNWKEQVEFQSPDTQIGDYSGRQIRYGIREHAMVASANGMAAFQRGAFIPIVSSFFQFYIYAAPALRMGALQGLRTISIGTHDSIGIGEDGPTHQSIGLPSLFRAMPNLHLIRPGDVEEVMGAWEVALSEENKETPTILGLSRQGVPMLDGTDRKQVFKGGYRIFSSTGKLDDEVDIILIGTGSELYRAVEVAKQFSSSPLTSQFKIAVVSMPSQAYFDKQPVEYRRAVLGIGRSLIIAIEAWSAYGWARYAHASISMHTFGVSAPQDICYEVFGFGIENMVKKIGEYVSSRKVDGGKIELPGVGEFEELLLGHYHPQH